MSLGSSKIIPIWSYFGLPYRVVTTAEGPNDGLGNLLCAPSFMPFGDSH